APALVSLIAERERGERRLVFGPLQTTRDGARVVPVALRTSAGQWLVAQLDTGEFQRMIAGLDTGRDGSVTILDRSGMVLAHSDAQGAHVGQRIALPDARLLREDTATLRRTSELDHVERETSFSATSGYPAVVGAGIGVREALAPWWPYAGTAALLVVLYWLGWWFLVRRMGAAEAAREAMLEELGANADWLRDAQRAARTGVWRMDPGQDQVRVSAQAAELFGLPAEATTIPLGRVFERMHPGDRARVEAEFAAARH